MGHVWRGVHVGQQLPVAIKVMDLLHKQGPEIFKTFRNEVRAMAKLNHPGIAMVFDYGEVNEAAEGTSRGRVVAGAPFLAMELCTGGTLKDLRPPISWLKLRRILIEVLDALSHAHARGVIHRDLKPAPSTPAKKPAPNEPSDWPANTGSP